MAKVMGTSIAAPARVGDADWQMRDPVLALTSIEIDAKTVEAVLQEVVEVVQQALPGAYAVSVTIENGSPVTAAATSSFAVQVDESQYHAGYGPCLDALRLDQTVVVTNQSTEWRWRNYTPRAVEAGVGSSVSVPLCIGRRRIASLNIYGSEPGAFSAEAVRHAENLAATAAVVVNNARYQFLELQSALGREQSRDAATL